MRDMSRSGVRVGEMSHNRERYESEWSKCERKGEKSPCVYVNRNITPLLSLKFLLKIQKSLHGSSVMLEWAMSS